MCKKIAYERKINIDESLYDIYSQVYVGTTRTGSEFNLNGMSAYPIEYTVRTHMELDSKYKYIAFKFEMKRMIVSNE